MGLALAADAAAPARRWALTARPWVPEPSPRADDDLVGEALALGVALGDALGVGVGEVGVGVGVGVGVAEVA